MTKKSFKGFTKFMVKKADIHTGLRASEITKKSMQIGAITLGAAAGLSFANPAAAVAGGVAGNYLYKKFSRRR